MHDIKDSKQAKVRIGYDGRVHKTFRGPHARRRFDTELKVLRYLEERGCTFVPRILDYDADNLYMVTTNCGSIVTRISEEKMKSLFDELETYGVRHEDAFSRNITYDPDQGRFCLIDFEFATILETGEGFTLAELEALKEEEKKNR